MDREKVIKGLEQCKEGGSCDGCQYDINSSKCIFLLHADAIALLKEQKHQIWEYQELTEFLQDKVKPKPQIVRCKDCKHGQHEEWDNGECVDKTVYCDGYGIHKPDWFCADGKRRPE